MTDFLERIKATARDLKDKCRALCAKETFVYDENQPAEAVEIKADSADDITDPVLRQQYGTLVSKVDTFEKRVEIPRQKAKERLNAKLNEESEEYEDEAEEAEEETEE